MSLSGRIATLLIVSLAPLASAGPIGLFPFASPSSVSGTSLTAPLGPFLPIDLSASRSSPCLTAPSPPGHPDFIAPCAFRGVLPAFPLFQAFINPATWSPVVIETTTQGPALAPIPPPPRF